jgi:lipopolysaccharide transport system permease protein
MNNLEMPVESEPAPVDGRPEPPPPGVLRIQPSSGWRALNLLELWRYRELLWFLAWRDIKLRYKQTVLGATWAIIQPLFQMIVSWIFFGRLAGIEPDGNVPYPVFSLCALVPWQLFVYSLTQSSNSVVAEQRLITKVYFPRLIIPIASVLSGLVDFLIAFGLLLVVMVCYPGYELQLSWAILTVPLFTLFAVATALSVGLWLSALNVQYRDFRYTVPFMAQLWMFASPVVYPSSKVPEQFRAWYGLNPMAGVIEGFRWALLGQTECPWGMLGVSILTVGVLLVGGLYYFRRMERAFADVV